MFKNRCTFNIKTSSLILVVMLVISGCSSIVSDHHRQRQSHSSSLADFLYPKKQTKIETTEQIPQLNLPINIGLAFLPSRNWRGDNLDTSNQYQLLLKIEQRFSEQKFIDDIKIIPSTYLRHSNIKNGSGFDTLDQVARLHDVDVMALVSYDQLTQTLQNNASMLYWTIVGMYIIPGNENTIQTFVDTAIFDVKSRKMLMRAPGISKIQKLSTAIGVDHVMQKQSLKSFDLAFEDMTTNLDIELLRLRENIKHGKKVSIQNIQQYSAAGSMNSHFLMCLILFVFLLNSKRKQSV